MSKLVMKRTEELVKCRLFAGKSSFVLLNFICSYLIVLLSFFVLFTLLKYSFWLLLSKKKKNSSKSLIYFICVQLPFLLKLF